MVYHSSAVATTAFQGIPIPTVVSRPPEISSLLPVAAKVPFAKKRSWSSNTFGRRRRVPSCLPANKMGGDEEEETEDPFQRNPTQGSDRAYLLRELDHVESLEAIMEELEALGVDDEDDEDYLLDEWDDETLEELFQTLHDDDDTDDDDTYLETSRKQQSTSLLENALLQGVVAPSAGVGSNCLPGDFNFDPLDLASKDYFPQAQTFFQNLIPIGDGNGEVNDDASTGEPRPKALILRDYREAEIRHGRLAMLAAVFWPLQELLDRLVLDEEKYNSLLNSLLYGGVTLPYFPLLMTAIMLLLGYLDIYSQTIKDVDRIGDAFLPGDCFWDPLQILTAAPDRMKRNMQERELFNGRFAMLAIAVFIYEEARTGKPVVDIPGNEILFEPVYQVPFIQQWLDSRFSSPSPVFYYQFSEEDVASAVTSVDLFVSKISESFALSI